MESDSARVPAVIQIICKETFWVQLKKYAKQKHFLRWSQTSGPHGTVFTRDLHTTNKDHLPYEKHLEAVLFLIL